MSIPTATTVPSIQNATFHVIRDSANYPPANWREYFLPYDSSLSKITDTSTDQQFERLKQEVSSMLTNDTDKLNAQKLRLIDSVERLGIAYHFKSETEDVLRKMYDNFNDEDDIYTAALRFRLIRQQGINVSGGKARLVSYMQLINLQSLATPCYNLNFHILYAFMMHVDTFDKFKESEGNFKASLIQVIPGMLSLYGAAHLGIRGEDILDEAIAFTTTNLQSVLNHVSPPLAQQVSHALKRLIRKCLQRLDARYYISQYSGQESHNETLLRFAKLDFNILQELHQKEVNETMEWNVEVIDELPKYMKTIYHMMTDVYNEIEKDLVNEGWSHCMHDAKDAMKRAVPMPLLEIVLNFTRAVDIIYKDEDGYINSYILKDYVASLLKDPVL